MRLSHVTFTGADDSVDPGELARLSAKAPLIEWGILFSAEDEGRPRFPSRAWRDAFHRAAPQARCAAHLCGHAMLDAMATSNALGPYQRVQLNFDARTLPAATLDRWQRHPDPRVLITQHNAANVRVHEGFRHRGERHAVLFDASSGLGVNPGDWPPALPGIDCGYAGGLGPDNIEGQWPRIAAAASRTRTTWIDMEGALRNGERFDLDRVRQVIEAVRALAGTWTRQ